MPDRSGLLASLVLTYPNLQRKGMLAADQIKEAVSDFLPWKVIVNTGQSILGALDIRSQYQLSFWNALILQAAMNARVGTLYTEDFSHGQHYSAVRVINPFK